MNNPDTFFDSAVLSALISSFAVLCIFQEDNNGFPKLEIIDGANVTGIIDQGTGLLKEGYALLKRDNLDFPTIKAYFTAGNIRVFQNGSFRDIPNNAPYPLLDPILFARTQ